MRRQQWDDIQIEIVAWIAALIGIVILLSAFGFLGFLDAPQTEHLGFLVKCPG